MTTPLAAILPVFALIAIGWACGRSGLLAATTQAALNGFVVRLALPVLLFQFVAEADWRLLWHGPVVLALAVAMLLPFAATVLATRGRDAADRATDALAAAYPNAAFMGIPIGQALFGTRGVAVAVIASLLTVCVLFATAVLLVEIDRHRARGPVAAARGVLASLARNPLVIGPMAGAACATSGLALPDPLHRVASLLGGTASPLALVTIGLFIAHAPARSGGHAAPLVAIKLLVQPLVVWLAARALGLPAGWTAAVVVAAALPTGTGPFMLAVLYARDAATAARVILIGTMLSAVTIPLLAIMLG